MGNLGRPEERTVDTLNFRQPRKMGLSEAARPERTEVAGPPRGFSSETKEQVMEGGLKDGVLTSSLAGGRNSRLDGSLARNRLTT